MAGRFKTLEPTPGGSKRKMVRELIFQENRDFLENTV